MTTTPNKDRIRKFVAALRSGEYPQTIGALQRTSDRVGPIGFCCLGVACEVAIQDGLELQKFDLIGQPDLVRYGTTLKDCSGDVLPTEVAEWYGFQDENPKLVMPVKTDAYLFMDVDRERQVRATTLNDSRRFDFNEIADAFERTYLK